MESNEQDKIIKDAQYRKGLSIAFFNATNAAIELIKVDKINMTPSQMEDYIIKWRDWFLEEHKKYYATVIAKVGVNYRADETIKKLKVETTLEGLKNAWVALSEDERRDGEIIKIVKELKEKYEKK